MARGSYINIRYLVEYVDEGTRPMLAADREIRKNVAQTSKVLADQGVVTADVAGEQVKLAQETARAAGAQGELGAAARKAATSEGRLGAASADAAVAAGRAAKAAAEAAAAYSREASAGTRVTGVTRQVNAAQSAAAASARRSAAAHDAAAVAVGRSANRFTAAGAAMQAHGKKAKETGHSLSGLLLPMALVAGGAGKLSVDFGRAMEQIHTQAGGSQREVDQLRGKVLELAKTLPQSPQELAGGLYHLESVGLRGAKAMDALKVAAEGAAVGNTDVESTATALGSAWLVNIKGAGDLHHVMAELNAAVGAGNVRMADLVDALGTGILPASKEAGLSLHDVLGALAVFTDEGYQASSAAAQFSTALHFLYNPTTKASQAFEAMGLKSTSLAQDLHKPQGLLVALRDLKSHLEEAGKHANKPLDVGNKTLPATDAATRQEQLLGAILPGGRGRIMLTLLNQLDRYQMKLGQIQHTSGNFDEAIAKTHETASFRLHRAWATIQADAIQLGDALIPAVVPAFEEIAHILGDVAHDFSELPVPVRTAVVAFTLAGAVLGPFLKVYGNLAIAGGAVAKGFGLARTALFGYTAAQKAAALATKETVAAEAVQAEVAGGKGVSGRLGARGGLVGLTTAFGSKLTGGRLGAAEAGLASRAGAFAVGGVGIAAGVALVDGIVHGIESKRPDFGGKFQDFLHGATFGIIGAAGKSLEQKITETYTGAINDGLAQAARNAERGYGEKLLEQTLNRHRQVALTSGDILGNPATANLNFAQLAARERRLAAQERSLVARAPGVTAGRGAAANPVNAQLQNTRDELAHVRAALAPVIKDSPKVFAAFSRAENLKGLRDLQSALKQTGISVGTTSDDAKKAVQGLQTRFHLSAKEAEAILAAWRKLPNAIRDSSNSVARFTTRNLNAGADRSVKEIRADMARATSDMKAHGVTPGTAEFTKEQQALARAAISNLKRLLASGVISADQYRRQLKKILRDTTLSTGQTLDGFGKDSTKGIDDMVKGWRDGFAKAGKITDQKVADISKSLDKMPAKTRFAAAQSMVIMAQQLADKGKLPQQDVDRLVKLLGDRFDDLRKAGLKPSRSLQQLHDLLLQLRPPAAQVVGSIQGVAGAFRNMLPKSVFSTIASMVSALGGLQSAATAVNPTLGAVIGLGAQILGGGPKKHKRAGGYAYQAGGLVPIMAAGGELAVFPDGRSALIAGDPRSDSTPLAVPPMTAILTGHGQQLVANGYTIDGAIRAQMPHFRSGGHVSPGLAAGLAEAHGIHGNAATIAGAITGAESRGDTHAVGDGGYSIGLWQIYLKAHPQYSRSRLFDPDYNANAMKQVSGGGSNWAPWTTYRNGAYRSFMGAAAHHIAWKGHAVGGGGGAGGAGSSGGTTTKSVLDLHAMSAAEARKALPRLVTPLKGGSFQAGYEGGLDDKYGQALFAGSDLWGALHIPRKTVTVSSGNSGRSGGGARGAGSSGGGSHGRLTGLGSFQGRQVSNWIIPALRYAQSRGWRGSITSGYRSPSHNAAVGGAPGSNHTKINWPGGAIDVGSPSARGAGSYLASHLRGYSGGHRLIWGGPVIGDWGHFSGTGHRRGGFVRRYASGGTVSGVSSGQGFGSFTFDPMHPPRPPAPWIVYTGTGSGQGTGSTGLIDPRHGPPATGPWGILRELEAVGARADAEAKAAMLRLVKAVDGTRRMSIGHIERLESRIRGEIRHLAKGGLTVAEQVKVRRLRGALSALETVIGGRVGNIVALLDRQRQALDERRTRDVDQQLRILGRDPNSSFGENLTANFLTYQQKELNRELTKMRSAFAVAKRHHDTGAQKDIQDKIHQLSLDIRETAVQLIEAHRGAIIAAAQESVNAAQYQGDIHQAGYEALQLQQQLRGTDPSNLGDAQERANYITSTIVPDLQKQQATLLQQYHTLLQTSGADSDETRQAFLAYLAKGNEISQQQLDAQNQIKDATQQTADNTKDFGGSLGLEFGGTAFTDLIRAGSGA